MTTPSEPKLPPSLPLQAGPAGAPPISKILLGSLVTGGAVLGGLFVLSVLFFAPRYFDINSDPASDPEVMARLQTLEARLSENHGATKTSPALAKQVAAVTDQNQILQQKIERLQQGTQQENHAALLALGITQLKTAYETGASLKPGIDTLGEVVSDPALQKKLHDLAVTTASGLPSIMLIRAAIKELSAKNETAASLNDPSLDWKSRARLAFGNLVQVESEDAVAQQSLIDKLDQAVAIDDMQTASALVKQLPGSEKIAAIASMIDTRFAVQNTLQQLASQATRAVMPSQGGVF